jgi:hypothetical protein
MSFDLVALETMVAFEGYEYTAQNFNAPGTYESRRSSNTTSIEDEYIAFENKDILDGMCRRIKRGNLKRSSHKKLACSTPKERLDSFKYMYQHLPFELVKFIIKLILESSNLTLHPITNELVNRDQMKLSRIVFFRMFRSKDAHYLWNKNSNSEISEKFCIKCGEARTVYRYRTPMPCLQSPTKTGCNHPVGNYYCHRAARSMGGYCWDCMQIVNFRAYNILCSV